MGGKLAHMEKHFSFKAAVLQNGHMETNDKRQLKVFLSYAHEDYPQVHFWYRRLIKNGYDAWLDKENLHAGQDWRLEITDVVRNADVVIFFLSGEFNKEGFRQKEVRLALDKALEKPDGEVYIIPARLEPCEIPAKLTQWHMVDLFEHNAISKLMGSLRMRAIAVGAAVSVEEDPAPPKLENEPAGKEHPEAPVPKGVKSIPLPSVTNMASAPVVLPEMEKATVTKWKFKGITIATIMIGFIAVVAVLVARLLNSPQFENLTTGNSALSSSITITLLHDKKSEIFESLGNISVGSILNNLGIVLGDLDRVDPPKDTIVTKDQTIRIIRVREAFLPHQESMPFGTPVVIRTTTIPEGTTKRVQMGVNGIQETTTRILYEDDVKVGESDVKRKTLQPPIPEINLVGVKSIHQGKIAFISGGNAWTIDHPEDSKDTPDLAVSTGDLDGRIFLMSPGGIWLLFTRKSTKSPDDEINTLWVKDLTDNGAPLIDLHVSNVVHFASFVPKTETTIAYSTVEPRKTAPGWQAHNDLYTVKFYALGEVQNPTQLIGENEGGPYGWWGTTFSYSADGRLAYARPDQIGLVEEDGNLRPIQDIIPYNTHSDWAWVPPISWSTDGSKLYFVSHASGPISTGPEESPFFDLSEVLHRNPVAVPIVQFAGMFANPTPSPYRVANEEVRTQVAFLQAILPEKSDTSSYRLYTMNADGSNQRAVLLPENGSGLEPQWPVWAPEQTGEEDFLAVVYEGNIWLLDVNSGESKKITDDGLVTRFDWK
jgi:resuscitation-promoting factor RpfB